jgi:type III pantothenate kinase
MLLAIDAGNTNITLGLFREQELIAQWRLLTEREKSAEDYGSDVRRLFDGSNIDRKEVDGIAIASVVPQLDQTLRQVCEIGFELTPLFLNHTTDTGLRIVYDSPANVGADRIADAVAAAAKYGTPCISVDCGTATTFNVVNAANEYIGGAIAPGIMIAAEALFARAAKLPRVEIKPPPSVIGSSTIEAMQSGLYYGYAGLVDHVLERMIAELQTKPRVIATGGLAHLLAGSSKFIEVIDETLTLDGLRLVYERNNT